jgi:hypothetical protein
VNRFLTIGTIRKGKSSGRPPVSDEIVEDLKEMVEKTLQIDLNNLVYHDALVTKSLKILHPYKISVVQELQPADYQSCV